MLSSDKVFLNPYKKCAHKSSSSTKQQQHSFEEGAIAAIAPISVLHPVPSVRGGPFQRNYTIDQLPDFNIDESTSHAALERVAALLISHQGFDSMVAFLLDYTLIPFLLSSII